MTSTEMFLTLFAPLVRQRQATVFCGAGVSVPAGHETWTRLVEPFAHELGLDASRENPLDVLQYYINQAPGKENEVWMYLRAVFSRHLRPTPYHLLLAAMPFERYWTTNYDSLLETAIGTPAVVVNDATLRNAQPEVQWVIKLNGSMTPGAGYRAVFSREHFEAFEKENPHLHRYLLLSLSTLSFLFVGFSMTDPTLVRALEKLRTETATCLHGPGHFYLGVAESDPYRRKRQKYWVNEMSRFSVHCVLVNTYEDVLTTLRRLSSRVCQRTVCVIGSLPAENRRVTELCAALGQKLAENGYHLITGCGHHVGDACALAALNRIQEDPGTTGTARVKTYFRVGGGSSLLRMGEVLFVGGNYTEMRRRMLGDADVCVAIGGGAGAREEIGIARELGVPVIPIACTGGAAREEWSAGYTALAPILTGMPEGRNRRGIERFLSSVDNHEPPSRRVPELLGVIQTVLEWKRMQAV